MLIFVNLHQVVDPPCPSDNPQEVLDSTTVNDESNIYMQYSWHYVLLFTYNLIYRTIWE